MKAAVVDVGEGGVMWQQEQRSKKLLPSHHGLRQMLRVHFCHLGRLSTSDAIMVLDLGKTRQSCVPELNLLLKIYLAI